jgi:hypothetical protein
MRNSKILAFRTAIIAHAKLIDTEIGKTIQEAVEEVAKLAEELSLRDSNEDKGVREPGRQRSLRYHGSLPHCAGLKDHLSLPVTRMNALA